LERKSSLGRGERRYRKERCTSVPEFGHGEEGFGGRRSHAKGENLGVRYMIV
jgi:hypothetical protein